MGNICKLCLNKATLRNSHILPEFFYLDTYDEIHRIQVITHERKKLIQKGFREYLLCQKCETKLSKYEKYAKELIQKIPTFSRNKGLGVLYSENVDYQKLKLFQLSLIWRAGISSHPVFSQIKLEHHEEKIRQLLYEENPGKASDYGCLLSIMLNTKLLHKMMQSPTHLEKGLNGHTAYKFVTGNLTWVFIVSDNHIHSTMRKFFLQETGLLRVINSRNNEEAELIKLAQTFPNYYENIKL